MGEHSERSEASDWTELERGFFAAAPPEVAIQPPPPPSFDDLLPVEPRRPERRRVARGLVPASRAPETAKPPSNRPASASSFFRRVTQKARDVTRPPSVRAWRWTSVRVRAEARRLTRSLRTTRDRATRGLGALLARAATDLPERPDGKAIVAAIAALIVVFGLSASVLGSRNGFGVPPGVPQRAVVAPVAAPTEPAVVAAPAAEAAPLPTVIAPKARAFAKRHHAKGHAAPAAPARVTAAPARVTATAPARRGPVFAR